MMFHVVVERSGPQWDASRPLAEQSGWDEHASFMDGLVDSGFIILGGPLADEYRVVHAVEAHHNEVQPRTIEAVLTQASDTCSAARPGARRESLENYIKRLHRIEEIATAKPGVEKVFAMQSGREVRVMVQPGEVDDLAASVMAREIAKQIEDELTYPGQIRVTVVRESRASEIAH